MPPRFRFTREQIVSVAFSVARRQGISAVTARYIGGELGSSPKVIFSLFKDMEELKAEVVGAARELYESYMTRALEKSHSFGGLGEQYISFAKNEPKLFQLLFMREGSSVPPLEDALKGLDGSYDKNLAAIGEGFGLSRARAAELYRHLWIYSHGIAVLVATRVCTFSDGEISRMLTEVFNGILAEYKSEDMQ